MKIVPVWLVDLREEARRLEASLGRQAASGHYGSTDVSEMDDVLTEAAALTPGRFDDDVFDLLCDLDRAAAIPQHASTRFLYSGLIGLEERRVAGIGAPGFTDFLARSAGQRMLSVEDVLKEAEFTEVEMENVYRGFPWRLPVPKLHGLIGALRCRPEDIVRAIEATPVRAQQATATLFARSGVRADDTEDTRAREVSAGYIAFRDELKRKQEFLREAAIELSVGDA